MTRSRMKISKDKQGSASVRSARMIMMKGAQGFVIIKCERRIVYMRIRKWVGGCSRLDTMMMTMC